MLYGMLQKLKSLEGNMAKIRIDKYVIDGLGENGSQYDRIVKVLKVISSSHTHSEKDGVTLDTFVTLGVRS